MVGRVLSYIVMLFLSISIYGQDSFVDIEIEPKTVETGQPFSITIRTNIDGDIEMTLPDEFIQSGARQSGMSSSVELIKGKQKVVRFSFQSFTGYFEEEGTYPIGPVKITTRSKEEHRSKILSVKVIKPQNMISEDPSRNLSQLIFGIIQQSKKEIYEGEPVLLEGKIYSQVEVLQVEDFTPFAFSGPVDSRLLGNSNRVTTSYEVINGKNLQTFRLGKSVVFPEKVGDYVIKPFQIRLAYNDRRKLFPEHAKIISNESNITVRPLPTGMPKEFIDAVGKFDLTAQLSSTHVKQEEVVQLILRVEGYGNLHNIRHPKLSLPSYLSIYGDPEVNDSISFTGRGAEGSKTFTYFIQVNSGENVQLNPIKIAYFNPKTAKYETVQCRVPLIKVEPNGSVVSSEEELEEERIVSPEMQPYIGDSKPKGKPYIDLLSGWGSVILFSPIMLGAALGLMFRIKKQNEESQLAKELSIHHETEALSLLESIHAGQNTEDVVDALHNSLLGYLAGHFKVNKGEISRFYLKSKSEEELSPEILSRIIHVFDGIDAIKYGDKVEAIEINQLIEEVEFIIKELL